MNELTQEEKLLIEKIKEGCLSEGIKILIDDIKKHKSSSDTIKIYPILDNNSKLMLSSQSDEMLKRLGYVSALEWVIGLMEYYQNWSDDASL